MERDNLTSQIIGAAIEVHRYLGPGLLENTYKRSLEHELVLRGLKVKSEFTVVVNYKNIEVKEGYRIDLLVEETVVLELKSTEKLIDVHRAQILTYLKLSGKKVGLLINFNVPLLKQGIERFIL